MQMHQRAEHQQLTPVVVCMAIATVFPTAVLAERAPDAETIGASQIESEVEAGAPAAPDDDGPDPIDVPQPAAEDATAPDAKTEDTDWVLQNTRDLVTTDDDDRPWHVSGSLEFHTPVMVDEDPANDIYLVWRLRADLDLFENARVFARLGLNENFSAEVGESGFLLQDTSFGMDYSHTLGLAFVPLDAFAKRQLDFEHRVGVYLPTSRESAAQDMYAAPYLLSRVRHQIIGPLIAGVDGWFRYRFHRYAEQAGLEGGMNTQLDFGVSLGVEVIAFSNESVGSVSAGADLSTAYYKDYASREDFEYPAELDPPPSSQAAWQQELSWDVYITYTPFAYMTVVVGVQTGVDILDEGIIVRPSRFIPGNRDDTELFVQLLARY